VPSLNSLLRLEWLAVLAASLVAYGLAGFSWWLFALLILAPDLSMLGYLGGPRIGAFTYNAVHTLIAPGIVALAAWLFASPFSMALALILVAHIAADRALGYGLKYASGFKDTHLGKIGRPERSG
jgi:Domain of unknown function (DUF4260)